MDLLFDNSAGTHDWLRTKNPRRGESNRGGHTLERLVARPSREAVEPIAVKRAAVGGVALVLDGNSVELGGGGGAEWGAMMTRWVLL